MASLYDKHLKALILLEEQPRFIVELIDERMSTSYVHELYDAGWADTISCTERELEEDLGGFKVVITFKGLWILYMNRQISCKLPIQGKI